MSSPACNGRHRSHTYKEGGPRKNPEDKKPETAPSQPSTPSGNGNAENPDAVLSEPPGAQPEEEEVFPDISLQPSELVEPEQRAEVKSEIKQEPKVKIEEKKEQSPSMTLPLALKRIHDKFQSPTDAETLFETLSRVHWRIQTKNLSTQTPKRNLKQNRSYHLILARRPRSYRQWKKSNWAPLASAINLPSPLPHHRLVVRRDAAHGLAAKVILRPRPSFFS